MTDQDNGTNETTKITATGHQYEMSVWKLECVECGEVYFTDKRRAYCPGCGKKIDNE